MCDTYGTVCVHVSVEKALCVIPMVQSVLMFQSVCVIPMVQSVLMFQSVCVIPMVQSVCFRGEGFVCDTH